MGKILTLEDLMNSRGRVAPVQPVRMNRVLACCVCASDILLQGTEEELRGDKICGSCYQAGVIWAARKALEERKGDAGASERTERADQPDVPGTLRGDQPEGHPPEA